MTDSQKNIRRMFIKYGSVWQAILLIVIAVLIWRIYFPAIMSPDSIDQYGQALEGKFVDWHPPLMSIVLSAIFKIGGGIGTLIFIQCLAALFGLRSALSLALRFFSDRKMSKQISQLIAVVCAVVFLIPFLTPFMFISVIFWKDAWLAIMLLWIISYLIWLFLNLESFSQRIFIIHILALSLISAAMVLVRHNAFVIIPVISLIIAAFGKIKFGKVGLAFGALPVLIAFSINPIVDSVFNVQHVKAGNLVVASDLTTMLMLYPELKPEYPATIRHKNNPRPKPKDLIIELGSDNIELQNEYEKTLSAHPAQFLSVKLYRFGQMLSVENGLKQKLAYDIIVNQYGLKINDDHREIRYKLDSLSAETGNRWYFVWISGLHVIWLSLNIIFAVYFLRKVFRQKDLNAVFSFLLFLIPLSYYFSYLLAATTPDYRFMYPATLLMQVYVISFMLNKILTISKKSKSSFQPES
ncbi:MAG: hypothetical protein ACR2GD_08940 [Pyrinomonadaceae bacterium]